MKHSETEMRVGGSGGAFSACRIFFFTSTASGFFFWGGGGGRSPAPIAGLGGGLEGGIIF